MKLAIMQPYFFPYIGYFQLINSVDMFVIYDNIQFTKKGWIQRNKILLNNKEHIISIPITKDSSSLNINQRYISEAFKDEKEKIKRKIQNAYSRAPYYDKIYRLICDILDNENTNLFDFLYNSLYLINTYLNIKTKLIKSSELQLDIEKYRGQDKVIEICKHLKTTHYINAVGGIDLYNKKSFSNHNIMLSFIKQNMITYKQFNSPFVPWLSIIDVMMFNDNTKIAKMLSDYKLI